MDELEEKTGQSIVGFIGLNGMETGLDAVLNHASNIIGLTQKVPPEEKLIIGKTLDDFSNENEIRGIKK